MKKARIALASICILAAAGGVMAAKARLTAGYITKDGITTTVTVAENCTNFGTGCLYTSTDGATFQLFKFTTTVLGGSPIYTAVKE